MKKNTKILVIADDLTGCGDIGYWGIDYGLSQKIFCEFKNNIQINQNITLINANTRFKNPKTAEQKIKKIANWATTKNFNFDFIFKKLDSTLRGNWIEENDAIIEIFNLKNLPIISAYPEYFRTTKNGFQYVNNQLLENTEYSSDKISHIPTMIKNKSKFADKMTIFNAENNKEIENITKQNINEKIFAGTAKFFGEILKQKYNQISRFEARLFARNDRTKKYQKIIIVAGSRNSITKKQLKYIDKYKNNENILIVKSPDNYIENYDLKNLMDGLKNINLNDSLIISCGGDTSMAFCKKFKINELTIKQKIDTGIVLCETNKNFDLILKSGGFGKNDFLLQTANQFI